MFHHQEFVLYSLILRGGWFLFGVAFSDITPSWSIGSSFGSADGWLSSQRFGILKCKYCLPLTTSLSPITAALFLGSKLLAFFIAGINIFLLISWTRLGKSSPILILELFEVAAHFPHLVAIASTSEPGDNRSWSPTALLTETVHSTKLELVYFFTLNLEVVGDDLPDKTSAVFIAGFWNFVKDHVPTSAVYFLPDQLVILVGLFLLAFCYAFEGFCLVFLSPVPELSFLPTPYRGLTRVGERRVQDNLHAHAQNEPIKNYWSQPRCSRQCVAQCLFQLALWKKTFSLTLILS